MSLYKFAKGHFLFIIFFIKSLPFGEVGGVISDPAASIHLFDYTLLARYYRVVYCK
jgi:hypothetical protein